MALNFNEDKEIFSLQVDDTSKAYLLETVRWTRFLGILLSVTLILVSAVMAFAILVYMPAYTQTPQSTSFGIGYTFGVLAFMLGTNFYPIFALLKFSSLTTRALNTANQQQWHAALRYQRNLYRYIGIFTIILLVVYGGLFLVAAVNR